jgi:hypothetical protein
MTVYARSDVLGVALSRSHGGCGEFHGRPVVNGAPVKEWAFSECAQCEKALRVVNDPHWAGMPSEIPETPDEVKIREDQEKRGQRDAATATSQALTQIANLPEGLATAFAQAFAQAMQQFGPQALQLPAVTAPVTVPCPSGHQNLASAKFCGECGSTLLPPLEVIDEPPVEVRTVSVPDDLDSKSLAELRETAKAFGVKTTNSRERQIALIREALGETN